MKQRLGDSKFSFPVSNFATCFKNQFTCFETNHIKPIFAKKIAMAKQQVLDTVKNLPDEFSLDELVERLIVLDIIGKGMQQVKEGQVVSSEEARKRFEKWLS